MITGPLKYYTVAAAVRTAVDNALTTAVQQSGVVPGSIAWDNCCGMLAVSAGRVFLSDRFPEEQGTPIGGSCEAPWEVVEITVQVIRCAPVPDAQGNPPTSVAMDTSAQTIATDAEQMMAAASLWICQSRDTLIVDGLIRELIPQGPRGGCVGSQMTVLVGLPRG